MLSVDHANIG